ncbi:MAG: heavy metal-binding domain-containing protein, partial [Phycisphaerales bacterium]
MERSILKKLFNQAGIKVILIIIVAFVLGYLIRGLQVSSQPMTEHNQVSDSDMNQQQWWTCSMHPQIRQPKPGKCPICLMDLIPVGGHDEQAGAREISFSKEALKLMEVQTTPVERKFVEAEIRMVGKVDYDETRLKHITAWVP